MKKKELLITLSAILALIIGMGLVSYAAFSYSKAGEKVNSITTGVMTMNYTESDNIMTITNALPTTDVTGKTRLTKGEYFDFSVTTTIQGQSVVNWEIAAEELADSTFDGNNIKYYLTKINGADEEAVMAPQVYHPSDSANSETGRPALEMSLATGSSNATETINYRLRLWVTDTYNPQGDGGGLVYKTKVNVYGKVQDPNALPVMKAYSSGSTDDYHNSLYKTKITSITTKTNTLVPDAALENWDISEKGNGSVIAYIEDDGKGAGTYKLTLGGQNGVGANPNASYAFADFSETTSIDLSNLDTSKVTDMSYMLSYCSKLTNVNIANFDTSNVINMAGMFGGSSQLQTLNLENFDTSKVSDMSFMFFFCSSLTDINLSSFNTANVGAMTSMFNLCSSLQSLDLSHFNTSKVTNMLSMFSGCSNLTNLNVSNFDTAKVTTMRSMFGSCMKLTNITLGVKWTNIPDTAFLGWTEAQTITVKGSCASKSYASGWNASAHIVFQDEPSGC